MKQQAKFIKFLRMRTADLKFLKKHERFMHGSYSRMWRLAGQLRRKDWTSATNKELARWYSRYQEEYALWIGAISTGILIAEALAINLKKELGFRSGVEQNQAENLDIALRTLSTPEKLSMTSLEELEFLRLLRKSQRKPTAAALKKHAAEWAYIPVYAQFAPWTIRDFEKRASTFKAKEINQKYKELLNHKRNLQAEKSRIFRDYRFTEQSRILVVLLAKYIYWRINDETTIGLMTLSRGNFFAEIAKRLFVSPKQLLHMTAGEVVRELAGKSVDLAIVNERTRQYAQIINPRGVAVITGNDLKVFLKKLRLLSTPLANKSTRSFQGTPAMGGRVRGKAKIVLEPGLIGKVRKGDILITTNTTPAYVIGMKIAGAILTEEGGITAHAAIVSRELGIPCIIGIPGITRALKDGDEIEVDANQGVIKRL